MEEESVPFDICLPSSSLPPHKGLLIVKYDLIFIKLL